MTEDTRRSIPAAMIYDLREAFAFCDKDNDDEIRAKDLTEAMSVMNYEHSPRAIQKILNIYDRDGNNAINFVEFVEIVVSALTRNDKGPLLKEVYKLFDPKKEGKVNTVRVQKLFSAFGDLKSSRRVETILGNADLDKDQKITEQEFYAILMAGIE